jgi:type I restriction enzyme S subunit
MDSKKISEIFNIEKGSLQSTKKIPGKYNFITASKEWSSHCIFTHDCEALVFASSASGSLGRTHYVNGKFIASDLCYILIPKYSEQVDLSFYWFVFNFIKKNIVEQTATGTSKLAINRNNFSNYKIPYFNIKHQKKYKERLLNIDQLKKTFSSNLSKELTYITKLRQAILQEAIKGKLTAGWRKQHPDLVSGENSADNLLKKIKEEKESLIKKKKFKKSKAIQNSITKREICLPDEWFYCKADEIFFVTKLAGFEYTKYIHLKSKGDIPVIRAQNVRPLTLDKTNLLYIDEAISKKLDRSALTKPCLLVTFIGAGIGDVATFNELKRWHLAPNVAKMEFLLENLNSLKLNLRYLNYYLLSNTGKQEIFKHIKATAQPSLSMGTIRDIDFIIPPLIEQNEIVNRVDYLMKSIYNLEKQINYQNKLSVQLTQSLLREAFEQSN